MPVAGDRRHDLISLPFMQYGKGFNSCKTVVVISLLNAKVPSHAVELTTQQLAHVFNFP
eukprot:IDg22616t1